MKRREAIKSSVFLAGCGLSAASIASLTTVGCKPAPSVTDESFLGQANIDILAELVETILPKTDTPGAKDAGVHLYIDQAVKDNLTAEDQALFKQGLTKISDLAKSTYKKSVVDLDELQRTELMTSLLAEGGDRNIANVLIGMTKRGFFTSEIGAKQFLIFDPIPGEYLGCIDLSEVGGTWAL
jgi:hypothetical protein